MLTLLNHPELFERLEEKILDLQLGEAQLSSLLQQIIMTISSHQELDREALALHISKVATCQGVMELLLNNQQLKLTRFAGTSATLDEAEKGWLDTLALQLHHGRLFAEESEAAS